MSKRSVPLVDQRTGEVIGEVVETLDDVTGAVVRRRPRLTEFGQGRTDQSFRDQVNINSIAKRVGGMRPISQILRDDQVLIADFSAGQDFTEAAEKVSAMYDAVRALPAEVKRVVRNDPAVLVDKLSDVAGSLELLGAGLDPRFLDPLLRDDVIAAGKALDAAAKAAQAPPPAAPGAAGTSQASGAAAPASGNSPTPTAQTP